MTVRGQAFIVSVVLPTARRRSVEGLYWRGASFR